MTTLLEQGIEAARAGRKAEALQMFRRVLEEDERNEQAWLWMSSVVESDQERVRCLQSVLAINPGNEFARLGLEKLASGASTSKPATATAGRRPFRLAPSLTAASPAVAGQEQAAHHAHTLAMPAVPDGLDALRQSAGRGQGAATYGMQPNSAAGFRQPARPPLIPVLIFGTLTVTALGGLGLILILALLT
ncbi:MAG: tetratricopeptide repeat protein [Anaerolineae bacterium]